MKIEFPKYWMDTVKNWVRAQIIYDKMIEVKFTKLSEEAKPPTRAHDTDAGWDMYASKQLSLEPFTHGAVSTGLAFELPPGWHTQIHTRSSYAKEGIRCHLGIIDAGYRGELKVIVHNHTNQYVSIKKGDRFCQLIFLPVPDVTLTQVDKLADSSRGEGGFGSSGK